MSQNTKVSKTGNALNLELVRKHFFLVIDEYRIGCREASSDVVTPRRSYIPLAELIQVAFVVAFIGDAMRPGPDVLFDLLLDGHEAAADVVQSLTESELDLVELLSDEGQAAKQVVQVGVDLLHAIGDQADLSFHRVHCADGAVDIELGLFLEAVEGLPTRRNFLVHNSDLAPDLTHFRLDFAAEVNQGCIVVLENTVVQFTQPLLHRIVGGLHDVTDFQNNLMNAVLEATLGLKHVV